MAHLMVLWDDLRLFWFYFMTVDVDYFYVILLYSVPPVLGTVASMETHDTLNKKGQQTSNQVSDFWQNVTVVYSNRDMRTYKQTHTTTLYQPPRVCLECDQWRACTHTHTDSQLTNTQKSRESSSNVLYWWEVRGSFYPHKALSAVSRATLWRHKTEGVLRHPPLVCQNRRD